MKLKDHFITTKLLLTIHIACINFFDFDFGLFNFKFNGN
jgi:hypothetical protein